MIKSFPSSLRLSPVTRLKFLAIGYSPFWIFLTVGSTPSILSALTVSLRDASEIYPMLALSSETDVIATLVEFVITAVSTVLSIFSP